MSALRRVVVAIALALGAGGLTAFGGVMMAMQGGTTVSVFAFAAAIIVLMVAAGDDAGGLPQ